jgi:hypothetical protein
VLTEEMKETIMRASRGDQGIMPAVSFSFFRHNKERKMNKEKINIKKELIR